ncbi:MAG TPA: PilZ domain-containing protein [Bryobacteraceae bacterium]|nr:PilZ domain-containing protein [Bryobacteraceae bacterium]
MEGLLEKLGGEEISQQLSQRNFRLSTYLAPWRPIRSYDGIGMHDNHTDNWQEKRREPRCAASGNVRLRFEGDGPGEVHAELLDVSASGFRTKHQRGLLPLGAIAAFHHPEAAGRARVVWNWMQDSHVESGFVIVSKSAN